MLLASLGLNWTLAVQLEEGCHQTQVPSLTPSMVTEMQKVHPELFVLKFPSYLKEILLLDLTLNQQQFSAETVPKSQGSSLVFPLLS